MRLVLKHAGRVFFVSTDEIDWIEAADSYVKLHVRDRTHLLRETMRWGAAGRLRFEAQRRLLEKPAESRRKMPNTAEVASACEPSKMARYFCHVTS